VSVSKQIFSEKSLYFQCLGENIALKSLYTLIKFLQIVFETGKEGHKVRKNAYIYVN